MSEPRHHRHLVRTDTDMIIVVQIGNVPIRAAQIEPKHEYDYGDKGDYIPEYADYDQGLDQDDVDLTHSSLTCG